MILRLILWIFLAYMIYIFIFRFLVPVFRVSRQMKNNIKNFQDQVRAQEELNQTQNAGFGTGNTNNNGKEAPKQKGGDYIDFEEIKEKKGG